MTELMDLLYQFALENRVMRYIPRRGYSAAQDRRARHLSWLEANLTEAQSAQLLAYRDAHEAAELLSHQAAFRAGVSLGMELSALER